MKQVKLTCIIDDDDIFVYGAKRLLLNAGVCSEFITFRNGKQAIEGLQDITIQKGTLPELIFLDLNMPIMTGWEFLDEFMKMDIHEEITLYIVSSSINPIDMDKAKEYEAVSSFIDKPITPTKLKEVLDVQ